MHNNYAQSWLLVPAVKEECTFVIIANKNCLRQTQEAVLQQKLEEVAER